MSLIAEGVKEIGLILIAEIRVLKIHVAVKHVRQWVIFRAVHAVNKGNAVFFQHWFEKKGLLIQTVIICGHEKDRRKSSGDMQACIQLAPVQRRA